MRVFDGAQITFVYSPITSFGERGRKFDDRMGAIEGRYRVGRGEARTKNWQRVARLKPLSISAESTVRPAGARLWKWKTQ